MAINSSRIFAQLGICLFLQPVDQIQVQLPVLVAFPAGSSMRYSPPFASLLQLYKAKPAALRNSAAL